MLLQFVLFAGCLGVAVTAGILHSKSIEYSSLEGKRGYPRSKKYVRSTSMVAVDLEMLFLLAIWFMPQPRFYFPVLREYVFFIPLVRYKISLFHLLISLPFIALGLWLIVSALRTLGNEISIEHRKPERIIRSGIFSRLRHPQNAGGAVLHLGMTILMSAVFAAAVIPLFIVFDVYIAKKEEEELLRSFETEYKDYQEKVPMFFPRIHG